MHREGDYERYKSFKISREQEKKWIAEFRDVLLAKISENPTDSDSVNEYCRTVAYYMDFQTILEIKKKVRENLGKLDSFSKLRYAEELVTTIANSEDHKDQSPYTEIRQTAIILL